MQVFRFVSVESRTLFEHHQCGRGSSLSLHNYVYRGTFKITLLTTVFLK